MNPWRRLGLALVCLFVVMIAGTAGYFVLGFGLLDAAYQTVTTVTTVGFREVRPLSNAGKVFTIVLILLGVGTALYSFGALLEVLVEGHISDALGRRRRDRRIAAMHDHVIICGWGRVGRVIAPLVSGAGRELVVIDLDPERVADVPFHSLQGDATDDAVLHQAGVTRAAALVAALSSDSDNISVTLSARTLAPDLFIVGRARLVASEEKLRRAGADRVVNPQAIGGARMAAFVLQPNVAEFLDVVMHDGSMEFRLEELRVPASSPLAGQSLRQAQIRDRTGALVLAVREPDGSFTTNPPPETPLAPDQILIAVGTAAQLDLLGQAMNGKHAG